jgi:DNA-binding beta-propeller fold protein YncE
VNPAAAAIPACALVLLATATAVGPGEAWARAAPGRAATSAAVLVWPAPPESARVRYVGMLTGESDLGRGPSFGGMLRRAAMGTRTGGIRLARPTDVYAEDSTRLYVTDAAAGKLFAFDYTRRKVETIGGSGPGALIRPMGLTGDGRGRIYVTDPVNRRVVVFDRSGAYIRALGGRATLLNPVDVAVDPGAGRVYVADSYLHQVVVFDTSGAVLRRIGRTQGSLSAKDSLTQGAAASGDRAFHEAARSALGSRDLRENRGGGPGEFLYPIAVAVSPAGGLFVCDGLNFRVQAFDRDGTFQRQIGQLGDTPGSFARPKSVAVDADGHLYVVDAAFNNLQIFDERGKLLLSFGSIGKGPGELWLPLGSHIDPNGRIYVADRYNGRVQIYQYLALESGSRSSPGARVH